MKHKLTLLLGLFFLFSAFRADKPLITIFMIGDSTMTNKSLTGGNPERGWGQMLPGYLSEEIRVDNHAVNGRSSKSFIDEGRWEKVISQVKKGDYVFIQFGHNDEKSDPKRYTSPGGTFDENLKRFVNETRAKGGIPVLFNSIVRRNFGTASGNAVAQAIRQDDIQKGVNSDATQEASKQLAEGDKLIDTHGAYLDAPRNVARELGVPFVDMNKITHDLVEGMGPVESKKLFMWVPANQVAAIPKGREDNTHLNIYGGRIVAGLAMDAIAKEVPELVKHVRHYDFVVAQDGSGDFFTVQEAINAVPDFRKNVRTTILVRKGCSLTPTAHRRRTVSARRKELPVPPPATFTLLTSMRRISRLKTLQVLWDRPLPALSVPTVLTSRNAVSSVSRIHFIPTVKAVGSTTKSVT